MPPTPRSALISATPVQELSGLTNEQLDSLKTKYGIERLEHLVVLDPGDFEFLLGSEAETFLVRKRLGVIVSYLKTGNDIRATMSMTDIVQFMTNRNNPSTSSSSAQPPVQDQQPQLSQLSERTIAGLAFMAEEAMAKKTTIVLSEVSMTTKNELIRSMGLTETTDEWPNKPDLSQDQPIDGYSWLGSSEDSDENRAAYITYLKDLLKLPEGYDLRDVKPETSLLSVDLSGNRPVRGTTDVTITRSAELHGDTVKNNIQVLLELKKVENFVKKNHTPQVVCEFIAAACLNESHPVVAVLTDLNQRWTFFWFAKREHDSKMALYRLPLNGAKSVAEAKYLLDSLYDDSSPRDKLPTTFVDRQSYEDFAKSILQNKRQRMGFDRDDGNSPDQDKKPPSSDGADRHSNLGTGGGFSSTSRGRGNQTDQGTSGGDAEVPMNMASTLSLFAPPAYRDVANELDLLDFVDVDEQYEIVRSFAEKHIVPYMRTVE